VQAINPAFALRPFELPLIAETQYQSLGLLLSKGQNLAQSIFPMSFVCSPDT
jgi:hypothetical protein